MSPMDLRTLLDWFIAYQLRRVEGVTEINAHGGEMKTYQVEPDPDKLATYRLSMTDLFNALRSNNANVGGGYLVHEGEARYIRGVSQVRSIDDIAAIVIDERNGVPVTVRDVAKVHPAPMIRAGLATRDGQGEIVTGLVMMLIGQNGREVVNRVKAEIERTEEEPAAGRDDRAALRPHPPDQPDLEHGAAQPDGRRHPGHGGPAGAAGKPAGRLDRRPGDSRCRCCSPPT